MGIQVDAVVIYRGDPKAITMHSYRSRLCFPARVAEGMGGRSKYAEDVFWAVRIPSSFLLTSSPERSSAAVTSVRAGRFAADEVIKFIAQAESSSFSRARSIRFS